ncbi:MAG: 50S ribosomal protein L29 [bacterium]
MKALKLHDFTLEELRGKLADLKSELFNLRFQLSTGQLRNPMRIKEVRKDIARILTVIRQKELEQEDKNEQN